MSNLTNYERDTIIRAIFADIPPIDAEAIKNDAQAAIVKHMSPACRRAYKECPAALSSVYFRDIALREGFNLIVGDADTDVALAPWREAKKKYDEAKAALRNIVYSCRTRKQFRERLPEFASYLPNESAPTKNLPAVANLVADLVKLGWKK